MPTASGLMEHAQGSALQWFSRAKIGIASIDEGVIADRAIDDTI